MTTSSLAWAREGRGFIRTHETCGQGGMQPPQNYKAEGSREEAKHTSSCLSSVVPLGQPQPEAESNGALKKRLIKCRFPSAQGRADSVCSKQNQQHRDSWELLVSSTGSFLKHSLVGCLKEIA